MKWFKHISDSLDDPFIFDLIDKFGGDGYLVFFGTIEIYAREYKPELGWKLSVTRAYLKQKLHKRQETLIRKILNFISNSGKWEITYNDAYITIFIPKFNELLDDWTRRKLRSDSVVTPKKPLLDTEVEEDKEEDKDNKQRFSQIDFDKFWSLYPMKKEKKAALAKWKSLLKSGELPEIDILISAVKDQIEWRKNSTNDFIPEWKHPTTWLNKGCWEDELDKTPKKVNTHKDIQPKTYAQAQDAERRQRAKWLLGEMENDKQENSDNGTDKVISLLPGNTV